MTALKLTPAKLGSTRCVECEKRFTDDPTREVVEVEGTYRTGGRRGYLGATYLPVMCRWHIECYAQFLDRQAELRAQVEADRQAALALLRESLQSTSASSQNGASL